MTLYDTLDKLGELVDEPPVPRIDRVPRPVTVNLDALTEQERKWVEENENEHS